MVFPPTVGYTTSRESESTAYMAVTNKNEEAKASVENGLAYISHVKTTAQGPLLGLRQENIIAEI